MRKYMARKALFNLRMLLAVGVSVGMLCFEMFFAESFITNAQYSGALPVVMNIYALSPYIIFAGMFPGIPYSFSFLEEKNSGYIRFVLQRMPAKRYIINKIVYSGLAGAAATVVPFLCIVLPAKLLTLNSDTSAILEYKDLIWTKYADIWNGNLVLLLKGLLLLLFGFLWAEIALLISLFVSNRYIAFALPFVIFQMCWILFPVRRLNPVFLIRSDFGANDSLVWSFAVLLIYIAVFVVTIYIVFERQVKHEKF